MDIFSHNPVLSSLFKHHGKRLAKDEGLSPEVIEEALAAGRMVLLGGRLLRDAVLLQNALSRNDAFCSAAKGAALLDLVLDVVDTCQVLVERGVPASVIERHDFGPVLRAREARAT